MKYFKGNLILNMNEQLIAVEQFVRFNDVTYVQLNINIRLIYVITNAHIFEHVCRMLVWVIGNK